MLKQQFQGSFFSKSLSLKSSAVSSQCLQVLWGFFRCTVLHCISELLQKGVMQLRKSWEGGSSLTAVALGGWKALAECLKAYESLSTEKLCKQNRTVICICFYSVSHITSGTDRVLSSYFFTILSSENPFFQIPPPSTISLLT